LRCPTIPRASIICTSESAVDASFGLAEAKALITTHRAATLAIAEALMIHRTESPQIDNIIAAAPEQARRADWLNVLTKAAEFNAGLES
jgi:hypothetical protein